ncbi:MAG: hypothetical protein MUD10_01360 [Candidatus Pacebacteria bacterium]|jgi:hypothetical protein|nr:hypothetical protein [Candidatus Paceibacterota bacterium]
MAFNKFIFGRAAAIFLVGTGFFILSAGDVLALRGNSGWLYTFYNSTSPLCGTSHYLSVDAYQRSQSTSVVVPKIALGVLRNSDSAVLTDISAISRCMVGPTCFNPCQQSRRIDITGNATYPDWGGVYQMGGCGTIKSKRVHDGIFMKPTAAGPDYRSVFPGDDFAWLNEDPSFQIELVDYPATISASPSTSVTGIQRAVIFDFLGGTVGTSYAQNFSGGKGIYTFPKENLADGTHVWSFYMFLGGGLVSARTPSHTFGLDRAMPVVDDYDQAPLAPGAADDVTITAAATDVLSGLSSMQIYIDGVLMHTCTLSGETVQQTCSYDAGKFAAGSSHSYAVTVTDRAGNTTPLSDPKTFTVILPPTVTADFSVSPLSGGAPLTVTVGASNIGGTATGAETYYFWNNCNSACAAKADCESVCGAPAAMAAASTTYEYAAAGSYYPRIVVERQGAYAAGGAMVTANTVNQKPEVTNGSANIDFDYCIDPASSIFSWTYIDPEGQPQSAYRVQAINETEADFNSPSIDSGKAITSNNSWGTVLPYGHTYRWRVMVWDSGNVPSDWTSGGDFQTPPHKYPKASFKYLPDFPAIGEKTEFTDTSVAYAASSTIKSWEWTFEEGHPATSNEQNPAVVFSKKENLKVTLKVTDWDDYTCSVTRNLSIVRRMPKWQEVAPF